MLTTKMYEMKRYNTNQHPARTSKYTNNSNKIRNTIENDYMHKIDLDLISLFQTLINLILAF